MAMGEPILWLVPIKCLRCPEPAMSGCSPDQMETRSILLSHPQMPPPVMFSAMGGSGLEPPLPAAATSMAMGNQNLLLVGRFTTAIMAPLVYIKTMELLNTKKTVRTTAVVQSHV